MHVTKETLFHYDRIGLFSPEIKEVNGYRFYSTKQIDTMNTILVLREMDLPLAQIKEFLNQRKQDKLLELFSVEEELIAGQIAKLQDRQQWIKNQRQKIRLTETVDFSSVYRMRKPGFYYCMKEVKGSAPESFVQSINSLIEEFQSVSGSICYEIGYIQNMEDIREGKYSEYPKVALLTEKRTRGLKLKKAEEQQYLIAYHAGHWEKIGDAYERLTAYADSRGIDLGEFSIERDVIDFMLAKEDENFVTEIAVPVRNSN